MPEAIPAPLLGEVDEARPMTPRFTTPPFIIDDGALLVLMLKPGVDWLVPGSPEYAELFG